MSVIHEDAGTPCVQLLLLALPADAEQKISAMQGPILRPIQRLGKLGKRSNVPQTETADPNQTKDPKFVYLSIDECGSHVGNRKTTFFRCVH